MKVQQLDTYRQVIERCYNSLDDEQDFYRLITEKVKNANSLEEKKEAVLYLIQSFALLSNSNYQTDVPILKLI